MSMMSDPLFRAWAVLIALSLGSTVLSVVPDGSASHWVIGLGMLGLSWAKARVILLDYLGLRPANAWRQGFMLALSVLVVLFAVLFVVPFLD